MRVSVQVHVVIFTRVETATGSQVAAPRPRRWLLVERVWNALPWPCV